MLISIATNVEIEIGSKIEIIKFRSDTHTLVVIPFLGLWCGFNFPFLTNFNTKFINGFNGTHFELNWIARDQRIYSNAMICMWLLFTTTKNSLFYLWNL